MKEWIYKKMLARFTKKYLKHCADSVEAQKCIRRCEFELDKIERLKVI